ncbi:hypothetical protein K458DRAFT_7877 [Lentithecium fluviatile CBS 122367]|uniref:Uncharacterized protein n=1 Tax=Lentithecium fluviatile CBS 122367 TaxID=1168545 RepID=A0A6G1JNW2_9PLEO|nr:hypothetical protein K458DRAFT_7877 [Lentithecium fluviatile CBS 122367]
MRYRHILDDLFANDPGNFISVTSHKGTSSRILELVGRDPELFGSQHGQIFPVLVQYSPIVDWHVLLEMDHHDHVIEGKAGRETRPGHCFRGCWGMSDYTHAFADCGIKDMHDEKAVARLLYGNESA